jgi:hypothetical protein
MKKNKIITLVVVVIIIILLALAGYLFYKGHHQAKPVLRTPLLTWIDVSKTSLPPYMVTAVPLFPKNSVVTIDRYYIDKSGATHGEYAFDMALDATHTKSGLYNVYLQLLKNSKTNTIKSTTSSSIVFTQPYYLININFTSPDKQTAQVDINYKFSPKVK